MNKNFLKKIPKAELHLHIEWTLEPKLMFKLAKKNNIQLQFRSIDDLKKAYSFCNLQDFLDIYYQWTNVLQTKIDFYELTLNYFKKISKQWVVHTEMFFDPQSHTSRWIPFHTVITWIHKAQVFAKKKYWITSNLIMCFLRHLSQKDALETLKNAENYKKYIIWVWLDSSEKWNPPSKFKKVFNLARKQWYKIVAHAGEEWSSDYIWEAIKILKIDRLDHWNRCLDDEKLVKTLKKKWISLTLCPLSNLKLKVVDSLDVHPIKKMLDLWLKVTINSDDPAYFGWYIFENYFEIKKHLKLTQDDFVKIAKFSIESSFISDRLKKKYIKQIDNFVKKIEKDKKNSK